MAFFDWAFKQRYTSEKEFLKALLTNAQNWFNEVTKPLEPLLFEIETGKTVIEPQKYAEIAWELYRNLIEVNSANYVKNTFEQMGTRHTLLHFERKAGATDPEIFRARWIH